MGGGGDDLHAKVDNRNTLSFVMRVVSCEEKVATGKGRQIQMGGYIVIASQIMTLLSGRTGIAPAEIRNQRDYDCIIFVVV